MNSREKPLVTDPRMKKHVSAIDRTFFVGLALWWTIFILIPVLIFAFQSDWTVTFSITSKIGIVFVCLSCILLSVSAKGTFKVVSRGGFVAPIDYEDEDEGEVVIIKEKRTINFWEILLMGRVWMLLWGFIYLLPLAFGVPFII
ncbi:MAG: hypothetical protein ACTSUP_06310 [Candidatus Heimdallarchaeaceae archaeon]